MKTITKQSNHKMKYKDSGIVGLSLVILMMNMIILSFTYLSMLKLPYTFNYILLGFYGTITTIGCIYLYNKAIKTVMENISKLDKSISYFVYTCSLGFSIFITTIFVLPGKLYVILNITHAKYLRN